MNKTAIKKNLHCGYHIEWLQNQYWVIGNGMKVACGENEKSAKFMLSAMTESPSISWDEQENQECK